jgi:Holliday junction resolvasome RuvABC DNA-binding subunit
LLIECDIDSIDTLRKMTIKDLTRIRGIKRKTAKKIKKEITMLPEETIEHHKKGLIKPKEKIEKEDKKKASKKEIKGFTHKGYTLFEKEFKTKSGKKYFIKIFSKAKPKGAKPIDLPKDFMAIINKKTGIPYLKKKK